MRSKLFVPASRPELFIKALRSRADSLCFDLEDAVLPHRKDHARAALAELLDSSAFHEIKQETGKTVMVRINAMDTNQLDQDLAAACRHGVDIINLPKADTPDAVQAFMGHLLAVEAATSTMQKPIDVRVLVNIETPHALHHAADIASAHERVWGLQLGLGDLFEPLGIARHDPQNVHAVMFALRMAAGRSGRIVYDTAYTDVANAEGYRAEAQCARRLGFLGKTCIHPSQVDIANAVFSPSADEVAWAEKVVAAAEANSVNGAYMLEGKMIDLPFVERAHAVLRQVHHE